MKGWVCAIGRWAGWRVDGFILLGAACQAAPGFALPAGVSPSSAPAAQWEATAERVLGLADRLFVLQERRAEISDAQGEAIVNASQCAQLLFRYCIESRLQHLLRALPPAAVTNAYAMCV